MLLGESREDAEKVTIIGAGLAGLMAAFELKKRQIPFQIFEASNRVGGRAYTVPEFIPDQSVAELGAEWIHASHRLVFETIKDLRLSVTEEAVNPAIVLQGDRVLPLSHFTREMVRLQRAAREPSKNEKESLEQWIQRQTKDVSLHQLVEHWSLFRYGVSAQAVSPQEFQARLNQGSPFAAWLDDRVRVKGGMSLFAEAFFDRLSGIRPEQIFRFRHRLQSVAPRNDQFELEFDTPAGRQTILARAVICALPVALLPEIRGMKALPGPWAERGRFESGKKQKILRSFRDRFWDRMLGRGRLYWPAGRLAAWEATKRSGASDENKMAVFTLQTSEVTPEWLAQVQRQLLSTFKQKALPPMNEATLDWNKHPFFKMTHSYPFVGRGAKAWKSGSIAWQWAGEHTSDEWPGTVQGALHSGLEAAEFIANGRRVKV